MIGIVSAVADCSCVLTWYFALHYTVLTQVGVYHAGAGCVILPDHVVKNPASLAQALATHRVTHLTAVPTLLQALIPHLTQSAPSPKATQPHNNLDSPTHSLPTYAHVESADRHSTEKEVPKLSLRVVVSSGEPLTLALANALLQLLPKGCQLLNLYGSTEVAADCTCFALPTYGIAGHNDSTSGPDLCLHASRLVQSGCADSDSKGSEAVPAVAEEVLRAPQTGQQAQISALLPSAALPAIQSSMPASTAASAAAFRQLPGAAAASGQPGVQDEIGALRPAGAPLSGRTQVAVGWPINGCAIVILATKTAQEEEAPEDQLPNQSQHRQLRHGQPSEEALPLSSSRQSPVKMSLQKSATPVGLPPDKKRKRGLTDGVSEAASLQSEQPSDLSHALCSGEEQLVGSSQIMQIREIGEVAVAGAGLALGYHRYGHNLGFSTAP